MKENDHSSDASKIFKLCMHAYLLLASYIHAVNYIHNVDSTREHFSVVELDKEITVVKTDEDRVVKPVLALVSILYLMGDRLN